MRVLVTGGGGFVGKAIVQRLLARGDRVLSLSRGDYPELRALGAETTQADLADEDAVVAAAKGCELVFHVAAKAGLWGSRASYQRSNVQGTRSVLAACLAHGIPRLVYTSSPSVVHTGGDIEGADESLPYPARFEAAYPETKAEAEQLVLAANGPELSTVSIRPHLVWGPGDNNLVPRVVARARAGRLRLVRAPGKLVDACYIDNAADAHLQAADRLAPGAACAGRAYFVANDEPLPAAELINGFLQAEGLPPCERSLSPGLAWTAGAALEALWTLLPLSGEPPMTRFLARQLATSHFYDLGAARRDLGYEPKVSTAEGMQRLAEHLGG